MQTPKYAIKNGRAVKAVRTRKGGLDIFCYVPERNEFERAMRYLEHLYSPTGTKALDTDFVSKTEFEEFVGELRRQAEDRA